MPIIFPLKIVVLFGVISPLLSGCPFYFFSYLPTLSGSLFWSYLPIFSGCLFWSYLLILSGCLFWSYLPTLSGYLLELSTHFKWLSFRVISSNHVQLFFEIITESTSLITNHHPWPCLNHGLYCLAMVYHGQSWPCIETICRGMPPLSWC